jgi:hypothetical protein
MLHGVRRQLSIEGTDVMPIDAVSLHIVIALGIIALVARFGDGAN